MVGVAHGERAGDGEDEHIAGGKRPELGFGVGGDGEAGDDDGELASGDEREPGTNATFGSDVVPSGRPDAGCDLGDGADAARPSAGSSTGGSVAGSTWSPKNTKNRPPNTSRMGSRSSRPRSAIGSDNATPTRNAATAAETRTCSASPPMSNDSPRIDRSSSSSRTPTTTSSARCCCRRPEGAENPGA